nr:uncharacterized protein LOC104096560 [Nicotiana tomentosiformis]
MAELQDVADWSDLQHDLLVLVVRRLNLIEDYLNFGMVCKSWHYVATKANFNSDLPRIPWLMLAEEEDDNTCRKFFSLYNGMILKKRIPGASGKRCVESMGWLITVGKDEGKISLLHPFSGVQIELSHQNTTEDYYELNDTDEPWTFIRKAVLLANPSQTSDYVLMVIEGPNRFLSFWRPGDLLWTRIRNGTSFQHVSDVVYFDGLFYTVAYSGCVYVCDVAGSGPAKSHFVAKLPRDPDAECYILESLGSLFVVTLYYVIKRVEDDRDRIPLTPIFAKSHFVAKLPRDPDAECYILESLGSLFVVTLYYVIKRVEDDRDRIPLTPIFAKSHFVAKLPRDPDAECYILESLGSLFVVTLYYVIKRVEDDRDRIPLTPIFAKSHFVAKLPRDPDAECYILESLGSLFVVTLYYVIKRVEDDRDRIPLTPIFAKSHFKDSRIRDDEFGELRSYPLRSWEGGHVREAWGSQAYAFAKSFLCSHRRTGPGRGQYILPFVFAKGRPSTYRIREEGFYCAGENVLKTGLNNF